MSIPFGDSEKMTGQALKDLGVKRRDVVLATKVLRPHGAGPERHGRHRAATSWTAVARSLERLQTDHIDLYQIHAIRPRRRRWRRPCARSTI